MKFENLVPGKYTLEETKAPEGYKVLEVSNVYFPGTKFSNFTIPS
ncbi:hypothetical protein COJ44_24645, partial [Bacillus anthracis]